MGWEGSDTQKSNKQCQQQWQHRQGCWMRMWDEDVEERWGQGTTTTRDNNKVNNEDNNEDDNENNNEE